MKPLKQKLSKYVDKVEAVVDAVYDKKKPTTSDINPFGEQLGDSDNEIQQSCSHQQEFNHHTSECGVVNQGNDEGEEKEFWSSDTGPATSPAPTPTPAPAVKRSATSRAGQGSFWQDYGDSSSSAGTSSAKPPVNKQTTPTVCGGSSAPPSASASASVSASASASASAPTSAPKPKPKPKPKPEIIPQQAPSTNPAPRRASINLFDFGSEESSSASTAESKKHASTPPPATSDESNFAFSRKESLSTLLGLPSSTSSSQPKPKIAPTAAAPSSATASKPPASKPLTCNSVSKQPPAAAPSDPVSSLNLFDAVSKSATTNPASKPALASTTSTKTPASSSSTASSGGLNRKNSDLLFDFGFGSSSKPAATAATAKPTPVPPQVAAAPIKAASTVDVDDILQFVESAKPKKSNAPAPAPASCSSTSPAKNVDLMNFGSGPKNVQVNPKAQAASDKSKSSAGDGNDPGLKFKEKGNELYKTGKMEDAIKAYTEAIDIDVGSADHACQETASACYVNRAMCYAQHANWEAVVSDCTAAIQINATYTKAFLRRAMAYEALEKYKKASEDFQRAIEIGPGTKVASEGLVRCKNLSAQM